VVLLGGMYLSLRLRMKRLTAQMERFLVSCAEVLPFSVREDALAPLHNAAAELENRVQLKEELLMKERRAARDLSADISHQLKTPLASLRLFCEMDEGKHLKEQLSLIERMEGLVQALLRLERLCAGGYEFTFETHDAAELVREVWQELGEMYPEKRFSLQGSAALRCDRRWLGEALGNLLKNACEHTAAAGEISVTLEESEANVFCTVQDDGGGVAEAELPRLFERFYRAHSRESKGAGIGLAIAREIVHRHHGSIRAENSGNGLRMVLALPVHDVKKT